MNVTVSVTTGTRIDVTTAGQRNVSVASPSALTLAQVDTLYYPRSNPSGFATGIDNSTLVQRAETGQFYPRTNPSGFVTSAQVGGIQSINISGTTVSGAITFTGIGGLIVSVTGQTIYFSGGAGGGTGSFYPSNNPSGFITGLATGSFVTNNQTGSFVDSGHTGSFITTGQTGIFYPRTNPSGFIIPSQTGLFVSQNNNIVYGTGDQHITGFKIFDTAISVTYLSDAATPSTPRIDVQNRQIFDSSSMLSISWDGRGLGDTGGNTTLDWANLILTGGTWQAQTLKISGQSVVTGGPYIRTVDVLNYTTGLSSGIEQLTVSFPNNLASQPIVVCDFQNDIDGFIYNHVLSSVSISGFVISFSDVLSTTGYKLHIRATI